MNIHIYGSQSFKKEISKILSSSKIKDKLGDEDEIVDIKKVKVLKEAVLSNPRDIFLIDNDKIIVNNFFTKVFSFLNPKDGIEKVFLEEHGVWNMSINSISDISKQILKRLEVVENNTSASAVLETTKIYRKPIEETNVGAVMAELTQLDEISEQDILSALSGIDGLNITTSGDTINVTSSEAQASSEEESKSHTIEVDSSNMDDVASLLEQLMNNKTLEISIKVKS